MINQSMAALGNNRSTIRELFEYGNSRTASGDSGRDGG